MLRLVDLSRRPMGACSEWIVGEHKLAQCEPYGTRRTRKAGVPNQAAGANKTTLAGGLY